MATKLYCDLCSADITYIPETNQGQNGDGMSRQVSIRTGTNVETIDLCVNCHAKAKQALTELNLPKGSPEH